MNFIVGVGSSLAAVLFIWVLQSFIFPEIRRRLFTDIPYIAGEYNLIKMSFENPGNFDSKARPKKVKISQWGSKVKGHIWLEGSRDRSKLNGIVSGNRILYFTFEPENRNINDFGTGVLRLEFDWKKFHCALTYLCACCEDITPTKVVMVHSE